MYSQPYLTTLAESKYNKKKNYIVLHIHKKPSETKLKMPFIYF